MSEKQNFEELEASFTEEEVRKLARDAKRYLWLRKQEGWPESEAEVSGLTPEQFDELIDRLMEEGK